jgi:hypothetical protein
LAYCVKAAKTTAMIQGHAGSHRGDEIELLFLAGSTQSLRLSLEALQCSVIESYRLESDVPDRPPQGDIFASLISVPTLRAVGRLAEA